MSPDTSTARTLAQMLKDLDAIPRVKRSKDLYFSDGNIVVVVENRMAFRVHASILSMHSEALKEMIVEKLPPVVGHRKSDAPHDDVRKVDDWDGFPILRLPGERNAAVKSLLGAFYRCKDTGSDLTMDHPDNVLRVLPISYRYEVKEIFATCVSLIKQMHSIWHAEEFLKWQTAPDCGWTSVSRTCMFIKTMREIKCTALLPAAFYALVCHKTKDVLKHLDSTEVVRFMAGREHLRNVLIGRVAAWRSSGFNNSFHCHTPVECAEAAGSLSIRIYRIYESLFAPQTQGAEDRSFMGSSPGFNLFKILHTVASGSCQLCQMCYADFSEREKDEAGLIWKHLPVIFDIGSNCESLKNI